MGGSFLLVGWCRRDVAELASSSGKVRAGSRAGYHEPSELQRRGKGSGNLSLWGALGANQTNTVEPLYFISSGPGGSILKGRLCL